MVISDVIPSLPVFPDASTCHNGTDLAVFAAGLTLIERGGGGGLVNPPDSGSRHPAGVLSLNLSNRGRDV